MAGALVACILVPPIIMALSSILVYIIGYKKSTLYTLVAAHLLMLCTSLYLLSLALDARRALMVGGEEFRVDVMGGMFSSLSSFIGLTVLVYSVPYMEMYTARHGIPSERLKTYYALLAVPVLTLYLLSFTNNVFIMWALVEATTLATVLLVSYGNYLRAVEGAWKYIVLCVVGLAMSLYGTAIIYSFVLDTTGSPYEGLFFSSLPQYAGLLPGRALLLAVVLIIFGYGVKAGVFPFHFWLPDAYTEAPTPVSALLSSVVTGCGYFAVLRWATALHPIVGGSWILLLVLALSSIFLGSASMIKQSDLKRLLAYSSIENTGIMMLALTYPPLGLIFGLMHLINHSLTKASAFMSVGCLEYKYRRRNGLSGVMGDSRVLGTLVLLTALALEGVPPTSMFTSIVGVATSITGLKTLLLYVIGVFIGFVALMHKFITTAWGEKKLPQNNCCKVPAVMVYAPLVLVTVTVLLGVFAYKYIWACGVCLP